MGRGQGDGRPSSLVHKHLCVVHRQIHVCTCVCVGVDLRVCERVLMWMHVCVCERENACVGPAPPPGERDL